MSTSTLPNSAPAITRSFLLLWLLVGAANGLRRDNRETGGTGITGDSIAPMDGGGKGWCDRQSRHTYYRHSRVSGNPAIPATVIPVHLTVIPAQAGIQNGTAGDRHTTHQAF